MEMSTTTTHAFILTNEEVRDAMCSYFREKLLRIPVEQRFQLENCEVRIYEHDDNQYTAEVTFSTQTAKQQI
jgi:hypothetical protein